MFGRHANPLFIVLILVVSLAVRLCLLGAQSLWLDEMTSLQIAAQPIDAILRAEGFDKHTPPAYYALLHIWLAVVPANEWGLRLFSAIVDTLNVLLVYFVALRMFREIGTARIAALFYASASFAVYYAQEGRMYSLLALLGLSAVYLALRLRDDSKLSSPLAFSLFFLTVLGSYTHYYFILFIVGLSLSVLLLYPGKRLGLLQWFTIMLLSAGAFLPWLQVVLELASGQGQQFRQYVASVLPYAAIRFTAGYGIMPLQYGAKQAGLSYVLPHVPLLILYLLAYLGLAIYALTKIRGSRDVFILLLSLLLWTPLIALIISFKTPMLGERYLTIIFPYFCLLLAAGMARSTEKLPIQALRFCVLLLHVYALLAYFNNPLVAKTNWRAAGKYLKAKASVSAIVSPAYALALVEHYYDGSLVALRKVESGYRLEPETVLPSEVSILQRGMMSEEVRDALEKCGNLQLEGVFIEENGIEVYRFHLDPSSGCGLEGLKMSPEGHE